MAFPDNVQSKFFVVTGANDGIGFETAKILCKLGAAHVTIACRNQEKIDQTIARIKEEHPQSNISGITLELSSLESIEKFAAEYKNSGRPLHALILNAGIFTMTYGRTRDDYENNFQINHLSQFYLTNLLLDVLKASSPSRVVVVASESHKTAKLSKIEDINLDVLSPSESNYSGFTAYGNTKMCNVLFANEFNSRYAKDGVTAHSLHPGSMVKTNISRSAWWIKLVFFLSQPFTLTVEKAAETEIFVATHPAVAENSGLYWQRGRGGVEEHCSKQVGNAELSKSLWQLSLDCLKKSRNYIA